MLVSLNSYDKFPKFRLDKKVLVVLRALVSLIFVVKTVFFF